MKTIYPIPRPILHHQPRGKFDFNTPASRGDVGLGDRPVAQNQNEASVALNSIWLVSTEVGELALSPGTVAHVRRGGAQNSEANPMGS